MNKTENKAEDKKVVIMDAVKDIISHPVTKFLLIGATVVGIVFISGLVMKVVSKTVLHFKDLRDALEK